MAQTDELPQDDRPDIKPDLPELRAQEKAGAGRHAAADQAGETESGHFNPDGDNNQTESPERSNEAAESPAHGAQSRNRFEDAKPAALAGDKLGAGFKAVDSTPAGVVVKAFLKRNKRKGGAAAAVIAAVVAIVFGIGAVVPYELKNIEKDLIQHVAKVEQHFEEKAAQKVMSSVMCRALPSGTAHAAAVGCTGEDDPADKTTEDQDPLASEEDSFDFTDPEVSTALEAQGIKVEVDANGKFAGLTDTSTGDPITVDDINNNTNGIFDSMETALPEWNIGQLTSMEPLMTEHAGSLWDNIPEDEAADDVDKTVQSDVDPGASATDILNTEDAGDESEGEQPPANATSQQTTDANEFDTEGGDLAKPLAAVQQAEAAGESGSAAVEAGVDAFNLSDPVFASSLLSTACSLKESVDNQSKQRVPTIMKLLERHFSIVLSVGDQIGDGKLNSGAINKLMELFNGDPSATQTTAEKKNNVPAEASLPFTSSAAWQRATGGTVVSDPNSPNYTPDISDSAKPTINTGTEIVNEIDQVPGVGVSCTVENSPFGFFVNGIANVAQVIGDIGSFGLTQAAFTAAAIGGNLVLQKVVLPDIIEYFTPVGLYGGEDSVQWLNNSDAGGTLAYSDYARSLGGQPLSTPTANDLTAEADNDQTVAEAHLSWTTRTFALSNPDSLVSRLAFDLPTSFRQATFDFSSFFTSLPSTIGHDFGALLTPHRVLADTPPQNAGVPYDVVEYGLTDDQVDKYDPIANENYLEGTITYKRKTATRLEMAGDPNQYEDGAVDTSTTDLLHCFLQGYDAVDPTSGDPVASETDPDPICGSMGDYDASGSSGALTPQPMDETSVAIAYCNYLTGATSFTKPDLVSLSGCINTITPKLSDDIGHYEEYIVDSHVMNDYSQLAKDTQ